HEVIEHEVIGHADDDSSEQHGVESNDTGWVDADLDEDEVLDVEQSDATDADAGPATEQIPVVEAFDDPFADTTALIDDQAEPFDVVDDQNSEVAADEIVADEGWIDHTDPTRIEASSGVVGFDDLAAVDVVDLDDEPAALFGTDVNDDAEVVVDSGEADPAIAETEADVDLAEVVEPSDGDPGFLDAFTAAMDTLPVRGKG
ncbi:MAG: hypothetical protein ACR2P0_03745, partial [Acidimicrobiales bacterium]